MTTTKLSAKLHWVNTCHSPVSNDKSDHNASLLLQAAQVFASGNPGSPQVVSPLSGSHALYPQSEAVKLKIQKHFLQLPPEVVSQMSGM